MKEAGNVDKKLSHFSSTFEVDIHKLLFLEAINYLFSDKIPDKKGKDCSQK